MMRHSDYSQKCYLTLRILYTRAHRYLECSHFRKHIHTDYMFSHSTIRNTVYSHIPTKQAKEIHGIVATFMLRQRFNRRVVLNRFRGAVNRVIGINRVRIGAKKKHGKHKVIQKEGTKSKDETRKKLLKALGEESSRNVRAVITKNSNTKTSLPDVKSGKSVTELFADGIFTTDENMSDDRTENEQDMNKDTKGENDVDEQDPWADLDATFVSDDSLESSDEDTDDEEALEMELANNRKRRENDPTVLIKKSGAVSATADHGGLEGAGYASYSHGGAFQVRLVSHLCFSDCAVELR